ncbi:MAG: hypothetical protein M3N47_11775 [Chloroflexota bacterium]|nr:hypothetical protein [Chloroflexota bacterium]
MQFGSRWDTELLAPYPDVNTVGDDARSDPNVADLQCTEKRALGTGFICMRYAAYGRFLTDQHLPITVYVGQHATGRRVTFNGYTLGGELVDSDSVDLPTGKTTYDKPLTLYPALDKPIVFFELVHTVDAIGNIPPLGGAPGFDDLTFNTPGLLQGSPPRFSLVRAEAGDLLLKREGIESTHFKLNRHNGSRGALSYTVEGVPLGVQAIWTPTPPTDAAAMTLTFTTSGAAPLGTYPIKITASPRGPDAGYGAPASVTFNLRIVAANCLQEVAVGPITALADCFVRTKGAAALYYAEPGKTVRMNGIDLTPRPTERIVLQPYFGAVATLDEMAAKASYGEVKVTVPPAPGFPDARIEGSVKPLSFEVPVPHGARAAQSGSLPFPLIPTSLKAPSFPLPLDDIGKLEANPDGSTTFTAYLRLPYPLSNLSAQARLTTTNGQGLRLDELHVRGKNIPIFGINFTDVSADYNRALADFRGSADADLPAGLQSPHVHGAIHFQKGVLRSLYAELSRLNVQIFPAIFLQKLGGGFSTSPLQIRAAVGISAGPEFVGDLTAAYLDGQFSWTFNEDSSWTLEADPVSLSVVGIPLVNANAHLYFPSASFKFAGHIDKNWGPLSIRANLGGGLNPDPFWFYVQGDGEICVGFCVSGSAIMSNVGVAGCGGFTVKVPLIFKTIKVELKAGLGWRWSEAPTPFTVVI